MLNLNIHQGQCNAEAGWRQDAKMIFKSSEPGSNAGANPRPAHDGWTAFIIGIVVIVVVLSFQPIVGIPRNDDFSYARTAEALAQTGRISYNGWGSPLMLPQAAIGALLIRVFGFSYSLLEGFGVVCAGATAAALFTLCRLAGLNRSPALFVVAVTVVNPMFLCTASTFMTDIPSLLLLLLSLCALVHGLQLKLDTPSGPPLLSVSPGRFWLSLVLGVIAGSNRQLSWIVYFGALVPIYFAIRNVRQRLMLITGSVVLASVATGLSLWVSRQPYTVPFNLANGFIAIAIYTREVLQVSYVYFSRFGLFLFPVVLVSIRPNDLKKLWFFGAIALTVAPLLFPINRRQGYFTGIYGTEPSGQYFSSRGVAIGNLAGMNVLKQFVPYWLTCLWTLFGVFALGIALYLLTEWRAEVRRATKASLTGQQELDNHNFLLRTIASSLLMSTVLEFIASLPWFAMLHMFDRYFLFYLPGLAIYFLLQSSMRGTQGGRDRTFVAVKICLACLCSAPVVLTSFAITATYINFGRAQATLYRRLLARGISPQQIDNGYEFDADAQVSIDGYVNSKEIVPASAYNPNAFGRNISSPDPGLYPVMEGHYILSMSTRPELKFRVDDTPANSESYMSYLPLGRQTVYVLHVTQ